MDVADQTKLKESAASEEHVSSIDIGELLVSARERLGLSSQDIADQMYLALSVIVKIEANDFEQDIPYAFIRGYLCSYARKVGVDVNVVAAEFDRITGFSTESFQRSKVVSGYSAGKKEINSNSFIIKLVTLVMAALLVVFAGSELWQQREKSRVINAADNLALAATEGSKEETVNNEIVSDEQVAKFVERDTLQQATSQAIVSGNQLSVTAVDSGKITVTAPVEKEKQLKQREDRTEDATSDLIKQLKFQFNGECWVSVTDANGDVLAVGVKHKGKLMVIEGSAPFTIILGDPSVVELEYEGKAYDLSGFRSGRRADLTLN